MAGTNEYTIGRSKRLSSNGRYAVYHSRKVVAGKIRDTITLRAAIAPHGAIDIYVDNLGDVIEMLEEASERTEEALEEVCYEIYRDKGQDGVYRYIKGLYPKMQWHVCYPCADETPGRKLCLVCGTYRPWVEVPE